MHPPHILLDSDASGAARAAQQGFITVIVDVIDMSTTLESALDAGALAVLGASPDESKAPVYRNPEAIARHAANLARQHQCSIIIAAEPRWAEEGIRRRRCSRFLREAERCGAAIAAIIPNIGAEAPLLIDMQGQLVVAISDTGGVAYDAAFQPAFPRNLPVLTATVARSFKQKGHQPAYSGARRALELFSPPCPGIAVIAASSNSREDVLAARDIAELLKVLLVAPNMEGLKL